MSGSEAQVLTRVLLVGGEPEVGRGHAQVQTGARPMRCQARSGCSPGLLVSCPGFTAETGGEFSLLQEDGLSPLLNRFLQKPSRSLRPSVETDDLQPQGWADLPPACPNPTALWWAEPAPPGKGVPSRRPCPPPPFVLLAPAGPLGPGSRTDTRPFAKHGVGREGLL